MSAALEVIYWRDIPAQVLARNGRAVHRTGLSERFQRAIDTAAMNTGTSGTDAYLAEWRKVRSPCSDDLEAEVRTAADRLETAFTDDVLGRYVRNEGRAP